MKLLHVDTSAQIIPLSYLMSLIISMMVLTTVVLSYQGMVDGTARFGFADIGNDVAGTIIDMRLAANMGSHGTVTRVVDIPPQVGGVSYVIKTNANILVPGTSTQAILVTARGTDVYIPLNNMEHGVLITGEVPSGMGQVIVEYDITNRTVTLR
ncbi:MAG: hypothetical protein LRZ87_03980 [Methanocellales archaeon]|nr:hypothetical protein [Methanocellales archaeon]